MNSRKYVLSITLAMYGFMIVNLVLWHGIVSETFRGRDLNRLGSIITPQALTPKAEYPLHHTAFADYVNSDRRESFDILTIGDSFSSGAYQDYLVNQYGLKIINAYRYVRNNCLEDLYIMLNSGVIDELKPKAVILESVERAVQGRMGITVLNPSDYKQAGSTTIMKSSGKSRPANKYFPPVMCQANKNYIANKIYHLMKPDQLSSEVYITELDRPFFTNPGRETTLLHYFQDIDYLEHPLDAEMVNQNLNTAARLLNSRGIKLIFFAAADKYDLYYPYIKDKQGRPENPFFQKMRQLQGKEYIFLDAMTPLREALARGEQDVYWLGDTHWSWKGIKFVCDEMVKYILP